MSMGYKQGRLSVEELHELKQLMGALLALLSFWSLGSLNLGGSGILYLGSLVALVAFVFPGWVARIPAVVWRWAGPALLLVIGADFILHIPQFIPPLVRMVVVLIIYRMLAPRSQREDLQVVLLCLFCVVISGVLTVSLLFAFQILLFTPLAMALLFVVCILDRGKDSPPHELNWEHFKWSRFIRRVWQVLDLRIVGLSGLMFLLVLAVSTLLFILTPRFDLNQAIPFLEISTSSRSGFSEDVSLGAVSDIQEDNSVALRIDVPSMGAVSTTPYWRMLVLDQYADGRFQMSQSLRTHPKRKFDKIREHRPAILPRLERSGALWTIYMEGAISRYLPLPGDYASLRFQTFQDVERIPDVHVFGLDSVGQNVFSYQFEDLKFNQRFVASSGEREVLRSLPIEVESSASLDYPLTCLELNLSADSVASLAEVNAQLLQEVPLGVVDYSQKVTDYLWQRFAYSLQPNGNRSEGDPVVAWLQSGSQGHCELFAGAFILLARQAGYPARMVVGFAGGSWNSVEDYFVVRNRDAHAWVEIYDESDGTWLRVDPTPGSGSSNPGLLMPGSMAFETGWSAWVDSLRIQWYRRIVNFEQKDQVELALTLKDVLDEYFDGLKDKLSRIGVALKTWVARPFKASDWRPLVLILVCGLGLFVAWRVRYALLGLLYRLLRRPKALDPVRRQASRYLQRFQAKGIESAVVAELQALRFGPGQSAKEAKGIFLRARQALKRRA